MNDDPIELKITFTESGWSSIRFIAAAFTLAFVVSSFASCTLVERQASSAVEIARINAGSVTQEGE